MAAADGSDRAGSQRGSGRADRGDTPAGPARAQARGSARGDGAPSRRPSADPTVLPMRRGISEARRYTPRGRTVRDSADPFRPALEVVSGGRDRTGSTRGDRTADAGRDNPATDARTGKPAPPRQAGKAASARQAAKQPSARQPATRKAQPATRQAATRKAGAPQPSKRQAGATGRGAGAVRAMPAPRRGPASRSAARVPQPRRGVVRRNDRRPSILPRLADPRRRLRVATLLVFALFAVVGVRLFQIQLTDAAAYAARGLAGRLHEVVLGAPRGTIYDRDGAVLAHSVEARYVYADPTWIENPADAAAKLSPLLGVAPSELLPKLRPHDRPGGGPSRFEWLARGVDIQTGEQVKALGIKGVGVRRDERRDVPGHDLAANLLGFVGDDLHGLVGIEARYDDLLYGVNGEREYEIGRGNLATEIPGGHVRETPAQPGTSLRLTIDRDLQYVVQQQLSKRMREVAASYGAAVVLDVRTGEVLAQASYPGYDAADPFKAKASERGDAATGIVVDPGSVHKAIVIGAALQEGVVKPDSTVLLDPRIRKGDQEFKDGHWLPPGTRQSLPGILAFSSNVGTIKIAEQLGPQKLYDYQRRFGLGVPTGVGLLGEASGLVQPPENWSGSSHGSIPIGHGVAVTPIQMAAAYAAIANDGVWLQPHLVRETIKPDGKRVGPPAPQRRQVLSPEHAAALRHMLEAVVTVPGATGRSAAVQGYRVAGKTGTGARVENGKYLPGEVASFIGMAPADAPRYVIAVFAHSPSGGGGEVSGPAFREMMEFTLRHYRVPPSGTEPPSFTVAS